MPEITSKSNITSKDALDFHKNGKPGKLQISATKPLVLSLIHISEPTRP